MNHPTLLQALACADMLEVDGLHAWQFSLDKDLLAQVGNGSAGPDAQAQAVLSIECIDGRAPRRWQFSLATVTAARFDAASDSWQLTSEGTAHRISCFAAISGDNANADDEADETDPL
ncbi:MAG: DUF5629 family protein [Pseudomonadota bacterium]